MKDFLNNKKMELYNFIESFLNKIYRWNQVQDFPHKDKLNDLFNDYLLIALAKFNNYEMLFNNEDVALDIIKAIVNEKRILFVKQIISFKKLIEEKNYDVSQIVGTSNKMYRNEGFSNFKSSSVEDSNNWNNLSINADNSTISDLYAIFDFYNKTFVDKLADEIAFNVLKMIY